MSQPADPAGSTAGVPWASSVPRTAFFLSGIAQRWAAHWAADGPGMLGDGDYQGTGPAKKPPNGEITDEQRRYNYSLNRLRAAVERAITH